MNTTKESMAKVFPTTHTRTAAASALPLCSIDPDLVRLESLRVVLSMGIDRRSAAACLGLVEREALSLWPASLYSAVAALALKSPVVFRQLALVIKKRLNLRLSRLLEKSPEELMTLFSKASIIGKDNPRIHPSNC